MIDSVYAAPQGRYDDMTYERCGRSGVMLPRVSLGLWQNFGDTVPLSRSRELLHFAFSHGVTHFDLANNYGPSYGSAEETFGRIMASSFRPYRDELFIATKAGYDMWPGPYGNWGSRKYLMASLDQSLRRMGLEYVDVFYSHRYDPQTPEKETLQALVDIVRQGKALYVGISRWPVNAALRAYSYLSKRDVPCLMYQGKLNIFDREPMLDGVLRRTMEEGIGFVSFSPLAQGLLTDRYLNGVPEGSRASEGRSLKAGNITPEIMYKIRALNSIAEKRGQTLAEMALTWVLSQRGVTSVIIGASSTAQIAADIKAANSASLTLDELATIDRCVGSGTV